MSNNIINIKNEAQFDQDIKKSSLPVLVDFWAEWCGPCRNLGATLERLGASLDGKVIIAKINVDEQPDLASAHNVRAIPHMCVYINGDMSGSKVGALSEVQLKDWLQNLNIVL
jgi:thioredoxin 1